MSALKSAESSSWIAFHGYAGGIMTLITKTGESYAATIPESRYSEFLKAPSQGSFFNLYIKPFATATAPKKARKAPAKSLLPTKPWNSKGGSIAWIDFRCLADPTTGPGLVAALKAFIAGESSISTHFLPIARPAKDEPTSIIALGHLGSGYVDPKYLKAFISKYTTAESRALARAYRSAYKSWARRQEVKKAYAHKASVMPSNPAVRVVTVPVGVTQDRVDMALRALRALEAGTVTMQVSVIGARVYVWDGRDLIGLYSMRTTTN